MKRKGREGNRKEKLGISRRLGMRTTRTKRKEQRR